MINLQDFFILNLVSKLAIASCMYMGLQNVSFGQENAAGTDKQYATLQSSTNSNINLDRNYSACSAAFHKDLKFISQSYVQPLRAAIVSGRKRDKSQRAKLIYSIANTKRSKSLNSAIQFAYQSARSQGADSWLQSEGGRWLADSISTGLRHYTEQDESPFLCTGVDVYLGYMEPHVKKITPINTRRMAQYEAAKADISKLFDDAYYSMRPIPPIPLPKFAPSRDYGKQVSLDVISYNDTVDLSNDDPDLPLISKRKQIILFQDLSDTGLAVETLYLRALETGHLPENTPNPVAGTGGDATEILQNTENWVSGRSPLVEDTGVRRQINLALSRVEILNAIDLGSYGLLNVEKKMRATFDAIRISQAKHCSCQ